MGSRGATFTVSLCAHTQTVQISIRPVGCIDRHTRPLARLVDNACAVTLNVIDYFSRLAGQGPPHWMCCVKRVNNKYLLVVVVIGVVVVVVGEDIEDVLDAGDSCKGSLLLTLSHARTSGSNKRDVGVALSSHDLLKTVAVRGRHHQSADNVALNGFLNCIR